DRRSRRGIQPGTDAGYASLVQSRQRPGGDVGTAMTRNMALRKSMTANVAPFGEAEAWHSVGQGWRQLFGSFQNLGFSFEWHDFQLENNLDWSRSFHPGSIEICLNLAGHGVVASTDTRAE